MEALDRKGWYPTLQAFGRFHANHPDTIMYVHTIPGREDGGYDLIQIAEGFGFRLHAPDNWTLTAGLPVFKMVELYNSFDVMMMLTRGEGFGIPLVESQACGTPVITTDFTAPADLVGGGWKVPIVGKRYTPMNSFWAEPDVDAAVVALEEAYALWKAGKLKDELGLKARNFAKTFDFDLVYKTYMRPFLQKAEAEIREKQHAAETAQSHDGVRQEALHNLPVGGVPGGEQRQKGGDGRGGGWPASPSSKRRRHRVRQKPGIRDQGQVSQ
jgi:hypothetical protein